MATLIIYCRKCNKEFAKKELGAVTKAISLDTHARVTSEMIDLTNRVSKVHADRCKGKRDFKWVAENGVPVSIQVKADLAPGKLEDQAKLQQTAQSWATAIGELSPNYSAPAPQIGSHNPPKTISSQAPHLNKKPVMVENRAYKVMAQLSDGRMVKASFTPSEHQHFVDSGLDLERYAIRYHLMLTDVATKDSIFLSLTQKDAILRGVSYFNYERWEKYLQTISPADSIKEDGRVR